MYQCHLQCFDGQPLFVACLNTSVLLLCCLCSVGRALTESGNCSDVSNVLYSSAQNTIESRRGTRTLIRQNSLLSSFSVRSELIVLHNASALAQEPATRIPKRKDLGPLRLPCPGTASGAPQRFEQNTPVPHTGRILPLGDRRADGDVRRPGAGEGRT